MLELTVRAHDQRIPLEVENLLPESLRGLTDAEIARLPLAYGNRVEALGEHITVVGAADDGEVCFRGDTSILKNVGLGMATGRITVEGDVGMHLGAALRGGILEVHGNASDWVGAEMLGGRIHIHGNAGENLGAVYRGGRLGMRGGAILVTGDIGNEAGANMRRGLIAVGGNLGAYTGISMRAGTILSFGRFGAHAGAGMVRGTLAQLTHSLTAPKLLPTFVRDGYFIPTFLAIFLRQLRQWQFLPARTTNTVPVCQRYHGDMLQLGKGEILIASHEA